VASSSPRPGVGSNGIHPNSGNQTSTQAWAFVSLTTHSLSSFDYSPLVNPTATREGTPRSLSMSAIAPA
jgi:hypothetical protein